MLIMIAGPYRHGSTDPGTWRENHRRLNEMAYKVFKKGHTPVVGVNAALPVIEAAGPESFDEIMMPVCLAVADRCDAVLRIGGPSAGGDREMEKIGKKGLPVFKSFDEISDANHLK